MKSPRIVANNTSGLSSSSFLRLKSYVFIVHVFSMCAHALCVSADSWRQSALSSYPVDSRNPTRAFKFGGKCLYPWSHLAGFGGGGKLFQAQGSALAPARTGGWGVDGHPPLEICGRNRFLGLCPTPAGRQSLLVPRGGTEPRDVAPHLRSACGLPFLGSPFPKAEEEACRLNCSRAL